MTRRISWSGDDAAFRGDLQAFLADHAPGKPPKDPAERLAHARAWAATKFDNGW
jgi:hypothetical protein